MKNKIVWVLWFSLIVLSWPVWAQTQNQALRIYMPRTMKIKGAVPSLGQVAILRGNEALVKKVSSLAMGRIAAPGGQVVIDRNTILSRLASLGVRPSDVTLSGAEKIVIQQQTQTVTSDALAKVAREAIKGFPLSDMVSQVGLVRRPANVIVPGADEPLSLKVGTITQVTHNQIRVRVEILQKDNTLAFRDILFVLRYRVYRLVTNVDILPGTAVDHSLVRVVEQVSNRLIQPKADALWTKNAEGKIVVREGLVALRKLSAGVVIRSGMIGVPSKAILVKRRQSVLIRLDHLGFTMSVNGVAQEDGSMGDIIKVKNADSNRLIMAQINADGSVAPVL